MNQRHRPRKRAPTIRMAMGPATPMPMLRASRCEGERGVEAGVGEGEGVDGEGVVPGRGEGERGMIIA